MFARITYLVHIDSRPRQSSKTKLYSCVYWLKHLQNLEAIKFIQKKIEQNWRDLEIKLISQQLCIDIQLLPEAWRRLLFDWLLANTLSHWQQTWTSSYLTYEKPERDPCLRLAGMPRHAHTLSCLLLGLCLPVLCFHGNIRIIPCWNILNIVNSCVSQSDIADALIALISECVCLVFSSLLPRSPSQYFYSLFIIMKIFFYHPPCSQACFSASSQKHVSTQDIKFSFCSSCVEVNAGIHCLAEGPLSREVCLYRGAWTWVLQWKTLSTLPTQSHTTNRGNSRLNKENERRINNHRWAEHGAAYYLDLEMEEKKKKNREESD